MIQCKPGVRMQTWSDASRGDVTNLNFKRCNLFSTIYMHSSQSKVTKCTSLIPPSVLLLTSPDSESPCHHAAKHLPHAAIHSFIHSCIYFCILTWWHPVSCRQAFSSAGTKLIWQFVTDANVSNNSRVNAVDVQHVRPASHSPVQEWLSVIIHWCIIYRIPDHLNNVRH